MNIMKGRNPLVKNVIPIDIYKRRIHINGKSKMIACLTFLLMHNLTIEHETHRLVLVKERLHTRF